MSWLFHRYVRGRFFFPFGECCWLLFLNGWMISVYVIMCHILCGVEWDFTLSLHTFCESLCGWGDACIGPLCFMVAVVLSWLFCVCYPPFVALIYEGWLSKTFLPFICLDGEESCDLLSEIPAFSQSRQARICSSQLGNGLASSLLKQGLALRKYIYVFAADTLIHMFLSLVFASKSLVIAPL